MSPLRSLRLRSVCAFWGSGHGERYELADCTRLGARRRGLMRSRFRRSRQTLRKLDTRDVTAGFR